jgi:hypothetical protein
VREDTSYGHGTAGGSMIAPVKPAKRRVTKAAGPKAQGLRGLHYSIQAKRAAAQVVDALKASTAAVILNQEEAIEVISAVMAGVMADARGFQAAVSQIASRAESSASRQRRLGLLHDWLDGNLERFRGRLEKCAEAAVKAVPSLGWSPSMVRREISNYRKLRKLDGC